VLGYYLLVPAKPDIIGLSMLIIMPSIMTIMIMFIMLDISKPPVVCVG
jgi:hypothetical protein